MGGCSDVCSDATDFCVSEKRTTMISSSRYDQVFKQNYLYTCGNEGNINQFQLCEQDITLVKDFGFIKKGIHCFAVTPNWKYFFIGGEQGYLCQFSVESQELVKDYGHIHCPQ